MRRSPPAGTPLGSPDSQPSNAPFRLVWRRRLPYPVQALACGDFNQVSVPPLGTVVKWAGGADKGWARCHVQDGIVEVAVLTLFGLHVLQPSMELMAHEASQGAHMLEVRIPRVVCISTACTDSNCLAQEIRNLERLLGIDDPNEASSP